MEEKGNNKSNKYYEATLPPNFCRPSHTNSKEFHKFLYEKYVLLRYIQVEDAALPISNIAAGNLQDISEEQYKCERDGGEDDHELDKFIEKIGENRKVAPKVIIGPVYQQKELEKQSILMKQQFINEDKRKEEQLYRSISAMHNISQRKKQLNHSHSEKMKPIKQEESKRQEELKLLQKEEKFQKYQQVEERRNSKRNEMKRRKFFLFYGNSSYAAARIHSFHDPNENNSCYPPLPKKSLLYKLDKKGLKYSIRDDE